MLEIIFLIILAILLGITTGLIPGLHINLLIASLPFYLLNTTNTNLSFFIISLAVTHIFITLIPSITLGAPDEDTLLSVLPGHSMMQEGNGHEAIIIASYGAITGIIISILIAPVFAISLPLIYPSLKSAIPFILIFISLYFILREERIFVSLIIFIFSGLIGYFAFNLPVKQPLTPLLTGLFGLSSILISLKNKNIIPKQNFIKPSIKLIHPYLSTIPLSIFAIPFGSIFPGIGSGHSSFLSSEFIKSDSKKFLFLTGMIGSGVTSLSFVTAYAINKTRTGSAAAVQNLLNSISTIKLIEIMLTILIISFIIFPLSLILSKYIIKIINKINYFYLNIAVIIVILSINIYISNFIGIIVLLTSASLGIFCVLSNIKRINLMGALILPTIIFYLTI